MKGVALVQSQEPLAECIVNLKSIRTEISSFGLNHPNNPLQCSELWGQMEAGRFVAW